MICWQREEEFYRWGLEVPNHVLEGSQFTNHIVLISLDELAIRRRRVAALATTNNGANTDDAEVLIARADRLSIGMDNKAKVQVNIYAKKWHDKYINTPGNAMITMWIFWLTVLICYIISLFISSHVITYVVVGTFICCVCLPCYQNYNA